MHNNNFNILPYLHHRLVTKMYLLKCGRITRKRFIPSEETLVSVLKARLQGETDKGTRSVIRQMLKRVPVVS
jgi:hypothetical protein